MAKKVKIFTGSIAGIMMSGIEKMEKQVNAFLEEEGKTIKVIDLSQSSGQGVVSVMIVYEEIK